jgi:hypothetical protein
MTLHNCSPTFTPLSSLLAVEVEVEVEDSDEDTGGQNKRRLSSKDKRINNKKAKTANNASSSAAKVVEKPKTVRIYVWEGLHMYVYIFI